MGQTLTITGVIMLIIVSAALGATVSAPIAFWLGRHFKIEPVSKENQKLVKEVH